MLKIHNIFKNEKKKLRESRRLTVFFLLVFSCPECEISLRIEAEGETKDVLTKGQLKIVSSRAIESICVKTLKS